VVRWGSRGLALRLRFPSACIAADAGSVPVVGFLCYRTGIARSQEKPLAGIAVEGIQVMVMQNAREVIEGQEGSQARMGSWRIGGLVLWMFASWLGVVGCRCIGLVEGQTEGVRRTADFAMHSVGL